MGGTYSLMHDTAFLRLENIIPVFTHGVATRMLVNHKESLLLHRYCIYMVNYTCMYQQRYMYRKMNTCSFPISCAADD